MTNSPSASSLLRRLTPEVGFDILRMYLGVGLAIRGVLFLNNPSLVETVATEVGLSAPLLLIALGHIFGGAFLAAGLFTRISAAVQAIPVLGALVLVHRQGSLATENQSLEFSGLVLAMLIFYSCFGAGQLSLDQRRRSH